MIEITVIHCGSMSLLFSLNIPFRLLLLLYKEGFYLTFVGIEKGAQFIPGSDLTPL